MLIRIFEADLLQDAGFEVIEAANADEALRELEARSDVQVLFTDIHMPGVASGRIPPHITGIASLAFRRWRLRDAARSRLNGGAQ